MAYEEAVIQYAEHAGIRVEMAKRWGFWSTSGPWRVEYVVRLYRNGKKIEEHKHENYLRASARFERLANQLGGAA